MLAVLGGVITASLLGSLHCAGMCGSFAAVASNVPLTLNRRPLSSETSESTSSPNFSCTAHSPLKSSLNLNAAYNLGRLFTYTSLGSIAGTLGAALNNGAAIIGLQHAAAILAGFTMILMGAWTLSLKLGLRLPRFSSPSALTRIAARAHAYAAHFGPVRRAATIGILTAFLPCGWLYAFLVTAAGTGNTLDGCLIMLAFWLGTVPMMTAVGIGSYSLLSPARRFVPALVSIVLIALGVWTLIGRWNAIQDGQSACPLCDHS